MLLLFGIVAALIVALLNVIVSLRLDSWYRRFDRGAPWQRRSWGFAS
jgi:hypothetical protein